MEAWETTAEDALPGLAVYNVHDSPSPAVAPNRAQVTLPGNLALRYEDPCGAACTVVANDIIPRGTKFGPMVGDIFRYAKVHVHFCDMHFLTLGPKRDQWVSGTLDGRILKNELFHFCAFRENASHLQSGPSFSQNEATDAMQ